ncbi:hypothetical protein Ancab_012052 [Ancistrocladus abbreviatus]
MSSISLETRPFLRSSTTNAYCRLTDNHLFKLSILKLDGSLFDVRVARKATVADLKLAVEEVFTLSEGEDKDNISWCHVWSHFCLCYQDHRLINDKAHIRSYGIKDGDMLHFIRHMTVDYQQAKRNFRSLSFAGKPSSMFLSRFSQEGKKASWADEDLINTDDLNHDDYLEDETPMQEFKLSHFLRGWLSYSTLRGVARKRFEYKFRPSRFTLHCVGGGPNMIRL